MIFTLLDPETTGLHASSGGIEFLDISLLTGVSRSSRNPKGQVQNQHPISSDSGLHAMALTRRLAFLGMGGRKLKKKLLTRGSNFKGQGTDISKSYRDWSDVARKARALRKLATIKKHEDAENIEKSKD